MPKESIESTDLAAAALARAPLPAQAIEHGDTSHVGRDLDGMPQPYAGAIVLLETIAEFGATAFFTDGQRTQNSNLCKRFANELRAAGRVQAVDVARDAARYRWLREQPFDTWKRIAWNTWNDEPPVFPIRDEDIDTAMSRNNKADGTDATTGGSHES